MSADEINGIQVPQQKPGSLVFDVEMLIDRTSIEAFYQRGQAVFVDALKKPLRPNCLEIAGDAPKIRLHLLKIYELQSIWPAR